MLTKSDYEQDRARLDRELADALQKHVPEAYRASIEANYEEAVESLTGGMLKNACIDLVDPNTRFPALTVSDGDWSVSCRLFSGTSYAEIDMGNHPRALADICDLLDDMVSQRY